MKDKLARNIFNEQTNFNKWLKELTESEVDHILSMMLEYHKAKMEEITDDDIVKWAEPKSVFIGAVVLGAKAMRDGEIKHTKPG